MKATTIELHLEGGDIIVVSAAHVYRICQCVSDQAERLHIRWIRKIPERPLDYAFTSHGAMFRAFEKYEGVSATKPDKG